MPITIAFPFRLVNENEINNTVFVSDKKDSPQSLPRAVFDFRPKPN